MKAVITFTVYYDYYYYDNKFIKICKTYYINQILSRKTVKVSYDPPKDQLSTFTLDLTGS